MQNETQTSTTPAPNTEPALSAQPASPGPNHTPIPAATLYPSRAASVQPGLDQLLNPPPTLSLQTAGHDPAPTVVDATNLPAGAPQHHARRRGRVASLPKLHRDMVNRMLWNGIPYTNIVAAVHEAGFTLTERNISNWATGGYLEWRLQQDFVIDNRLDQDHLVDHLRTDDASQLPEVGLQAAATRLSQIFLQKIARAEDVETNLGTFPQMVDILCRLNREIAVLQKQRDDSSRSLGAHHDPLRIKNEDQKNSLEIERGYSDPEELDSTFEKPSTPPLLPPWPTSTTLEIQDLANKRRELKASTEHLKAILSGLRGQEAPASAGPAPFPRPTPPQLR